MRLLALRDPTVPLACEVLYQYLRVQPGVEVRAQSLLDPLPLHWPDLVLAWLQDPCDHNPDVWRRACAVEKVLVQQGIPIINRPSRLPMARKSRSLVQLVESGLPIRVARVECLRTADGELCMPMLLPPYFVREDHLHASVLCPVFEVAEAARAMAIAEDMREPVAVEYIETKAPDARYWTKYRYAIAGQVGVPLHAQVSEVWETRGDVRASSDEARAIERAYIDGPINCVPVLHEAMAVLGFTFGAFDYAIAPDGQIVVWEFNPLPHLHVMHKFDGHGAARNAATYRFFDAVLAMCKQFSCAGVA